METNLQLQCIQDQYWMPGIIDSFIIIQQHHHCLRQLPTSFLGHFKKLGQRDVSEIRGTPFLVFYRRHLPTLLTVPFCNCFWGHVVELFIERFHTNYTLLFISKCKESLLLSVISWETDTCGKLLRLIIISIECPFLITPTLATN